MIDVEKFRTRWFRWLGAKTRVDRDCWVDLLESRWSSWANSILRRSPDFSYPVLCSTSTQRDVYYCFRDAIAAATEKELRNLDSIFAEYEAEKKYIIIEKVSYLLPS